MLPDFLRFRSRRRCGQRQESMPTTDELRQDLAALPTVKGFAPADLIGLPDSVASILRSVIRRGSMPLNDLAALLGTTPEEARPIGQTLVAKGFLVQDQDAEAPTFRANHTRMRARNPLTDLL